MILILADQSDPWGVALARSVVLRGGDCLCRTPLQIEQALTLGLEPLDGAASDIAGIFWGMNGSIDEDSTAIHWAPDIMRASDWLTGVMPRACRVVNRPVLGPRLSRSIGSPVWDAVVHAHGFQAPSFFVADRRDESMPRLDERGREVYIKVHGSEHGGLVVPVEEGEAYVATCEPARSVLLAPVPRGQVISVFVVGGRVAATVVREGGLLESTRTVPHLGTSLLTHCSELAQSLELSFAECLLVIGEDGELSCLDVIGRPNYWSCPRDIHPHVVNQLAVYLSGERSVIGRGAYVKTDSPSPPGSYSSAGGPEIR